MTNDTWKNTDKINQPKNIGEFSQLNLLRDIIDNIDSAILSLLAHRGQIIDFIIKYKRLHSIDLSQSDLRQNNLKEILKFSEQLKLNNKFVKLIFDQLYKTSSLFICSESTIRQSPDLNKSETLLDLNRTLKSFDISFCSLLSERIEYVRKVGKFKQEHNIEPLSKERWESVLKSKQSIAEKLNINPESISQLYGLIHEEALNIESKICNGK